MAEAGGWSIFVPGLPVAADGATFDEAVGLTDGEVRAMTKAEAVERLDRYWATGTTGSR